MFPLPPRCLKREQDAARFQTHAKHGAFYSNWCGRRRTKTMINVISVIASAMLSFCIAKFVRARSRVLISVKPHMEDGIEKKGERAISFILTISNGWLSRGVTWHNVYKDLKPVLSFNGFHVQSITTINNDLKKFYIPVVPVDKAQPSKVILNIDWIRSNTKAKFLIKGVTTSGLHAKDIVVDLFPGLFHDVKIRSTGNISKTYNRDNFGAVVTSRPYTVYEKI